MKFQALDLGAIGKGRVVRIKYDGSNEQRKILHDALRRVGVITGGGVQVGVGGRSPDP